MKCQIKLFFFVLFLTKEIISVRGSHSESKKYDITKHLNRTICKVFESVTNAAVTHLLKKLRNYKPMTYEYNLTRKMEAFPDRIIFRNLTINDFISYKWTNKYIEYDFLNNKIRIGFAGAVIEFLYNINSAKDTNRTYHTRMQVQACYSDDNMYFFINVIKLPETNFGEIFQIDVQSSNSTKIGYQISYVRREDRCTIYTGIQNRELEKEIESKLPSILVDNMNHNELLKQALNESYGFWPKQHLLAKRPDFLDNEQQYYYLIPTAEYFCFKLINITIWGLSNFDSLKHHYSPDRKSIHTLWINDIVGNAILDYGRESEPHLELHFQMDRISISEHKLTELGRGVKVKAHWYSVRRGAKENNDIPLTHVQSQSVIQSIESAIAFSLIPHPDVRKVHEMIAPLKQKCSEISPSLSWEDMKESYRKWIPFNDI